MRKGRALGRGLFVRACATLFDPAGRLRETGSGSAVGRAIEHAQRDARARIGIVAERNAGRGHHVTDRRHVGIVDLAEDQIGAADLQRRWHDDRAVRCTVCHPRALAPDHLAVQRGGIDIDLAHSRFQGRERVRIHDRVPGRAEIGEVGGGDGGRHGSGKPPRTPWGQLTLGYRTRRRKDTSKMIVRSRHEAKGKR